MTTDSPRVGLFATCLVDLMRPSVGFATVKLLEMAGCTVDVPAGQTCCGQPAFNSGDSADALPIARQVIDTFEGYDYVVVPSGSCGGMIKKHFPELFADDAAWLARAEALSTKTHELLSFLVDVRGMTDFGAVLDGAVTYHDSCSSLREMKVHAQPRRLMDAVDGLTFVEAADTESCCGFGGLFCVKYPDISGRMVDAKVDNLVATGADMVVAGDLGCLMNIAGRARRRGEKIEARHLAEVLAGMTDTPAIAGGDTTD